MTSLEGRIKRLITTEAITRIDFRATGRKVIAEAIPNSFHPIVEERRSEKFKQYEGVDVTLDTLASFNEGLLLPIARVEAETFDGALDMLKYELQKKVARRN